MHCNVLIPNENKKINEDIFATSECKLLNNK